MALISLVRRAQALVPGRLLLSARLLVFKTRALLYQGSSAHCPCCGGNYSRFLDVGKPARRAACPGCDSRERQRLLCIYLKEQTDLFESPLRVLHIAPEDCLQPSISRLPNLDYVSADIASTTAMVRMDITNIRFPADSFDVILCSHVLEHVADDRQAMRELCRILKPGGWAILQVPLRPERESTSEDPNVVDPAERERLYGQWDHVRAYGRDYSSRLEEAGFEVDAIPYPRQLGPDMIRSCGLDAAERVYRCRKADETAPALD